MFLLFCIGIIIFIGLVCCSQIDSKNSVHSKTSKSIASDSLCELSTCAVIEEPCKPTIPFDMSLESSVISTSVDSVPLKDEIEFPQSSFLTLQKFGYEEYEGPEVITNNSEYEGPEVITNNSEYEAPEVITNNSEYEAPEVITNNSEYEAPEVITNNSEYEAPEVITNNSEYEAPEVITNNSESLSVSEVSNYHSNNAQNTTENIFITYKVSTSDTLSNRYKRTVPRVSFSNRLKQSEGVLSYETYLSYILLWDPIWFDESFNLRPVILYKDYCLCGRSPTPVKDQYASFSDYESAHLPWLLAETWENIKQDNQERLQENDSKPSMIFNLYIIRTEEKLKI
ncbi:hypothetical protein I4U23_016130 [Adineta vaga]|nr:hypothetical protein I4U23_016130 [Adineta vaga]